MLRLLIVVSIVYWHYKIVYPFVYYTHFVAIARCFISIYEIKTLGEMPEKTSVKLKKKYNKTCVVKKHLKVGKVYLRRGFDSRILCITVETPQGWDQCLFFDNLIHFPFHTVRSTVYIIYIDIGNSMPNRQARATRIFHPVPLSVLLGSKKKSVDDNFIIKTCEN